VAVDQQVLNSGIGVPLLWLLLLQSFGGRLNRDENALVFYIRIAAPAVLSFPEVNPCCSS